MACCGLRIQKKIVKLLVTSLALCSLLVMPITGFAAAPVNTDEQTKAMLRQFIKDNPDVLLDVLKDNSETILEIAQQGSVIRKRKALISQWENDAKKAKKIDLKERAFRGKVTAPVTITAYSDFTCPYCRQGELTLLQLLQKYDGKVRVTFKALPKENYPLSLATAKYGTAALMMDPVRGWEFFDAIFNGLDQFERDGEKYLIAAATKAGLDFKQLKKEAGSAKVQARIDADVKEADELGITGTPYYLVNDLIIRGALPKDAFEDAIEMALKLSAKK